MEINNSVAAASIAVDLELANNTQQSTKELMERSSRSKSKLADEPKPEQKAELAQELKPGDAEETTKKSEELSEEQAQKQAKELAVLLNKPADTEIKFDVKLISTAGSEDQGSITNFRFQVVEKGTGKVIRQFPPEDINGLKERVKATPGSPGILFDSVA